MDADSQNLADLLCAAQAHGARFAIRGENQIEFVRWRLPDDLLAELRARRYELYAYLCEWDSGLTRARLVRAAEQILREARR